MSETVLAAVVSGVLSLLGVVVTLLARRAGVGEVRRLRAELGRKESAAAQLRLELERYRAAYVGLLELTQDLLDGDSSATSSDKK